MGYRIYIYAIMLFLSSFASSGINFNGLFKVKHEIEAKIFVMLVIMALSYLSSSFIIAFLNL